MKSHLLASAISLVLGVIAYAQQPSPVLRNQFDYARERAYLKQQEDRWRFSSNIVQSADEQVAAQYLDYLTKGEEEYWSNSSECVSAIYFTKVRERIRQRPLYTWVRKMPKGGNLHLHDFAWGDRARIIRQFINDPHIYINANYEINFFLQPPAGWVRANTTNVDEIIKRFTMNDYVLADTEDPWVPFQATYDRAKGLFNYEPVFNEYVKQTLDLTMADNVQYVELRTGFGKRYVLDPSAPKGGQRIIDPTGATDITSMQGLIESFVAAHPNDFIGARAIYQISRNKNPADILAAMQSCVRLRQGHQDFLIGFDLVGQEDAGMPLLYFLEDFSIMYNNGSSTGSDLPFYLHVGESNWESNSAIPTGIVTPVDNFYDALLLGSKRFAHGMSLYKRPYLLQRAREANIALEVCPISNMILGYYSDLRTHPAVGYLRTGLQAVIASDDPGVYGYLDLSFDFYQAIMAFGLDLRDLKTLANNSLTYSALSPDKKEAARQLWLGKWNNFVADLKNAACDPTASFRADAPSFQYAFPNMGPLNYEATVQVYGSHFWSGMCNQIMCQFGASNTATKAVYRSAGLIECPTPYVGLVGLVNISVALNGRDFINTGLTYNFQDFPPVPGSGMEWWEWFIIALTAVVGAIVAVLGVVFWCKRSRAADSYKQQP